MKHIFKTKQHFGRNWAGVSLIEVVVSIAIFNVIMVVAVDSYLNVIKINRQTVYEQSLQEHTRFLYELMTKEIKMAKIDEGGACLGGSEKSEIYRATAFEVGTGNNELRFQNYRGDCVRYFVDSATQKLKVQRGSGAAVVIMPDEILVDKLQFEATGLRGNSAENQAPTAVIYLQLKNKNKNSGWQNAIIDMQSTISGRYLE